MTGKEHPPKSSSVLSVPSLGSHEEIVSELLSKDGIAVLAEGLGLATVLAMTIKKSHEEATRIETRRKEKMRLFEEKNKNKTIGEEFVLPAAAAKTATTTIQTTTSKKEEENNTNNIVKPKVVAIVGASETLRTATIREYERLYPEVALRL